jgi:hypothetical protein
MIMVSAGKSPPEITCSMVFDEVAKLKGSIENIANDDGSHRINNTRVCTYFIKHEKYSKFCHEDCHKFAN